MTFLFSRNKNLIPSTRPPPPARFAPVTTYRMSQMPSFNVGSRLRRDKSAKNLSVFYKNGYWKKFHVKKDLFRRLHSLTEPAIDNKQGHTIWFNHGRVHRDNDEPAIELNGSYHNPFIEYFWATDDMIHRETGPARITIKNNTQLNEWFFRGKEYSFEDWIKLPNISKEERILLYLKWK